MDEKLKLHKNGNIEIIFGDSKRVLRPPKLGEFRKLKSMVYESAQTMADRGELAKTFRDGDIETVLQMQDKETEFMLAFVRLSFDLLLESGDPLPEDEDDLPVWLTSSEISRRFIEHWRAVPLDPGATGRTTAPKAS